MSEFAAQWSKSHELTNSFKVDDKTYNEFQAFVNQKHREGDIKLDALYKGPIRDLKEVLKQSGFKASSKELDQLQASIIREVQNDFDKYKTDIKEDLEQSILARYLPESMLIEQSLKTDKQVAAAVKLVSNGRQFDNLLAKGSAVRLDGVVGSLNTANKPDDAGGRLNMKW
jgi:carboxyl-terminal processing protease